MYIILMNPIIIPLFIALVIILHHYKKHSSNPNFTLLEKFVQINDINKKIKTIKSIV